MFGVQSTSPFVFGLRSFRNVVGLLIICPIVDGQPISEIFQDRLRSQLNRRTKRMRRRPNSSSISLTRITSRRTLLNGFPMMLIDFIFLFNAIFDGILKPRDRPETNDWKKKTSTRPGRYLTRPIVLNSVKGPLVPVKLSIYFHEDSTRPRLKGAPTADRSFQRVDYLPNEFPRAKKDPFVSMQRMPRTRSPYFQSSTLIQTGKLRQSIGITVKFFQIDQIAETLR